MGLKYPRVPQVPQNIHQYPLLLRSTPSTPQYPAVAPCAPFLLHTPVNSSTPQHPTVLQRTSQYPTKLCRYGDYKLAWLPSLPPLSDQLISIKLAFLSMKIVENYKENMLRSSSDSTYISLLKIKNSVRFLYTPVKPSTLQCIVVPCTFTTFCHLYLVQGTIS